MKTQKETTETTDEVPATFSNWREYRRFQAWELKQQGWSQTRIAKALGVTDGAVSQWLKRVREDGVAALRTSPRGWSEARLECGRTPAVAHVIASGVRKHMAFEARCGPGRVSAK